MLAHSKLPANEREVSEERKAWWASTRPWVFVFELG